MRRAETQNDAIQAIPERQTGTAGGNARSAGIVCLHIAATIGVG